MSIKITTLVENSVYGKGLQGEHGLSLLVDTGGHRLLFDTGASDLFIRNARMLGIDLKDVDFLVLSHGHRDHTGGLHHFLQVNQKAEVVCKKELFIPKCVPAYLFFPGWLLRMKKIRILNTSSLWREGTNRLILLRMNWHWY